MIEAGHEAFPVPEQGRSYLNSEFEQLGDTFDLIRASGANSFGFVVTEPATHEWAMDNLPGILEHPDLVLPANTTETLTAVEQTIQKGRQGRRSSDEILLDLTHIDFDNPLQWAEQAAIFNNLNMGRNLLTNAALLTVLVVRSTDLNLYQQLPDLFSCRSFVGHLTIDSKI